MIRHLTQLHCDRCNVQYEAADGLPRGVSWAAVEWQRNAKAQGWAHVRAGPYRTDVGCYDLCPACVREVGRMIDSGMFQSLPREEAQR